MTANFLMRWLAGVAAWLAMVAGAAELAVVEEHGDRSQRINMVFLAEGYTAAEMGKFAADTAAAVEVLFNREPWREYRTYCNVYRIEVVSAESGCDYGDTSGPTGTRDTWFDAGFTMPDVPQWISPSPAGDARAFDLLDSHVPEYDIAVMLVNDSKYGGSGGPIAVVTTHALGAAVIEHELGHSFANLADEYDVEYPEFAPAEAPNNTAETSRALVRWSHWFEPATPVPTPETVAFEGAVGLFEGSMYRTSGWYRPHLDSVMRRLNRPCGAVNREQLVLSTYALVDPLDGWSPDTTTRSIHGPEWLDFAVIPKISGAGGGPLAVSWEVDGVPRQDAQGAALTVPSEELGDGYHEVTARVRDPTPFVRRDEAGLLAQEVVWPFFLTGQPPGTLAAWRGAHGGDLTELAGDGLCNLVKYALGLSATAPAAAAERPAVCLTDFDGARHPVLSVPRRLRRPDVSYIVETSDDLATWRSGAGHTVVVLDEHTVLQVRAAAPVDGLSRRFMRLRISAPP